MLQNKASTAAGATPATTISRITALIPGVFLCIAVAGVFRPRSKAQNGKYSDTPFIEALVLAILVDLVIRSFWKPPERWLAGIAFSAKQLLEVAVVLLGASISFAAIAASGIAPQSPLPNPG